MSTTDVVVLSSDDEDDNVGAVNVKPVKMEPDLLVRSMHQKVYHTIAKKHNYKKDMRRRPELEENSAGHSGTSVLDQERSPVDDSNLCSTSPVCAAPLVRQFWKAGNYEEDRVKPNSAHRNATSYLHIHPKFLHSNATSHKWAFGAIAELLDNAVDEIQNGATFVIVDKTLIPRNGGTALLIQDDGGGMDPEAMRRCLSFGFSNKKSKSAIGQYGNGFKTSSMRLGADAIVFSRHRKSTQSIGLLSYTFLTQTGHDRIVVPMVDYEFNVSTGTSNPLQWQSKESFSSNLSILLQWSPYATEKELLKQFDDIGGHGTKVIIYNLWLNDERATELDFESDPTDIRISGGEQEHGGSKMSESDHIANRLRYSLRAYLSVLYMRLPSESFCMLLRGQVVEYHNIATELKYPEFIMYKPQSGGCVEGSVLTTIGFLKEAPVVNIHGFNVYHKNRLILPFWRVVSSSNSRGRGVVGVLEANFIEPTHNKQDFEKTSVFQKLEARLKDMTLEYWDYHCGLIGYHVTKKPKTSQSSSPSAAAGGGSFHPPAAHFKPKTSQSSSSSAAAAAGGLFHHPAALFKPKTSQSSSSAAAAAGGSFHPPAALFKPVQLPHNSERRTKEGTYDKRKGYNHLTEPDKVIRRAESGDRGPTILDNNRPNYEVQTVQLVPHANLLENEEAIPLMKENEKLHAECLAYAKTEEELNLKVNWLRTELLEAQKEYARLLAESRSLGIVKNEKDGP